MISYVSEGSDGPAKELAEEISSKHAVTAVPCRADVGTPEGVQALIAACKAKLPPNAKTGKLQIDIIVNNAAVMLTGPVDAITPEQFQQVYTTNVLGPILLVGAAKAYLPTDRSGRIVNISSTGTKTGLPYLSLYAGSKGAIESLTRVWARELAENATVNAINPGSTLTEMFRSCSDEVLGAQALWAATTPLAGVREWDSEEMKSIAKKWGYRPAYVEEVAGIVATVCNPEAGWMTGSVVSANGGQCFST